MRFFRTAAGPSSTPYPKTGIVYYAELQRDVTFPKTVGSSLGSIASTGTGHFEYLGNVGGSIVPIGALVKAVKLGRNWWIDTVVSDAANSGIGSCDFFDCTYPGIGKGKCDGLLPEGEFMPDYVVDFGVGDAGYCNGLAAGIKTLVYYAPCEWRSYQFDCGNGHSWFWKLTIDPAKSLPAGEVGQVILQLFDHGTGLAVDPPITYCINGGYPLWCANCTNQMQICCGIGANAQATGHFPARICVTPQNNIPDCTACTAFGIPQFAQEYLLTVEASPPCTPGQRWSACCTELAGSFVLEWAPNLGRCVWVSPWLGKGCDAGGIPPDVDTFSPVWILTPGGQDNLPSDQGTAWLLRCYYISCRTGDGHETGCDDPPWFNNNAPLLNFNLAAVMAQLVSQVDLFHPPVNRCPITGGYAGVLGGGGQFALQFLNYMFATVTALP
jgi:hypothetical protein